MVIDGRVLYLDDQQIPLPNLPVDAIVTAWRVGKGPWSGTRFFITPEGQERQEPPADQYDWVDYIGECILPAADYSVCLQEAKERKLREINDWRESMRNEPVEALGRRWDADARARELIMGTINFILAGGPLPPVWRDYDNNDMPLQSVEQLIAIGAAIFQRTETLYVQSWQRKAAVDAAKTIEEVDAA